MRRASFDDERQLATNFQLMIERRKNFETKMRVAFIY